MCLICDIYLQNVIGKNTCKGNNSIKEDIGLFGGVLIVSCTFYNWHLVFVVLVFFVFIWNFDNIPI
jgi:hypothetical protein